ncbi:MAG TPA: HEAT repeat domain-containing protein, partial [Candidatus Thermoplasmatota archaeon]|nr:HEAT repeat domain-containing protein [Candidatus Thermoplasmatota archaeon]
PPPAGDGARSTRAGATEDAGYTSVDPAPPLDGAAASYRSRVAGLRGRLTDPSLPMFQRMRCVFTLRNLGGPEAIDALAACFADPSALLRHEVAYVMGQMQDPHAIPALTRTLMREDEHVMVRHECAEALGAIGRPESLPVLERYAKDPHPEVAESCVVALDLIAWVNSQELEYANA